MKKNLAALEGLLSLRSAVLWTAAKHNKNASKTVAEETPCEGIMGFKHHGGKAMERQTKSDTDVSDGKKHSKGEEEGGNNKDRREQIRTRR